MKLKNAKEHYLVEVPTGISVVKLDVQAEGPAGECFIRDERVCEGSFLLGLHLLVVRQSGEVLDVISVVHGVAEGSLH